MINDLSISFPDFKINDPMNPEEFDTNNHEIVSKINALIAILNKITDSTTVGDSGADNIKITPLVTGGTNILQELLDEIFNNKVSKVEGKGLSAEDYTTLEKAKLSGITAGATKTESSATNGNIKINGTEKTVYTHPGGTNPHSTTKADVGLINVENKSSETIRGEITNANVTNALGYTPLNSAERLVLGKTSSTAFRGDCGEVAYEHAYQSHAPYNAQKNSDITKAEIEAKLTGTIATHEHDITKAEIEEKLTGTITTHGHNSTINTETLAGDKTLTKDDATHQYLNPDGVNRKIILPVDVEEGKIFVIRNNGSYNSSTYLHIKQDVTETDLDYIYAGATRKFVFDGLYWVGRDDNSDENNISIGRRARSYLNGFALGYNANGSNFGVALGKNTNGSNYGVAVGAGAEGSNYGAAVGYHAEGSYNGAALGDNANGSNYGVALGENTNGSGGGVALGNSADTKGNGRAIAKGYGSKCERRGEEWKSSDGVENKYGYGQLNWHAETTTDSPTEIFLNGMPGRRAFVLPNSAFAFRLNVIAFTTNGAHIGKVWRIEGGVHYNSFFDEVRLIGNTVLKTVISQDANTESWDVEASDGLQQGTFEIKVVGANGKAVRWNVEGSISEVRF